MVLPVSPPHTAVPGFPMGSIELPFQGSKKTTKALSTLEATRVTRRATQQNGAKSHLCASHVVWHAQCVQDCCYNKDIRVAGCLARCLASCVNGLLQLTVRTGLAALIPDVLVAAVVHRHLAAPRVLVSIPARLYNRTERCHLYRPIHTACQRWCSIAITQAQRTVANVVYR